MEKRTNDRPGVRPVVPSTRVLPGPPQNTPSLLSPRGGDGDDIRPIQRIGSCDTLTSRPNTDAVMPTSSLPCV